MPRITAPLAAVVRLVCLAALAVSTAPVAAQDATPGAGAAAFPITPDPADCRVAPRSPDELLALWYAPDGSPVAAAVTPAAAAATALTIPVGPPADEATVAGVVSTVREVFGCFAAGDFRRATALFTDDLARGFGPESGTTEEEARAFLEATPEPGVEGEAGEIVAVTDVMELGEGRVGAFVVTREAGQLDTVYAIFEGQGDRWLADTIVDFADPVVEGADGAEGDEGE